MTLSQSVLLVRSARGNLCHVFLNSQLHCARAARRLADACDKIVLFITKTHRFVARVSKELYLQFYAHTYTICFSLTMRAELYL